MEAKKEGMESPSIVFHTMKQQAFDLFSRKDNIILTYLFGSRAEGRSTSHSDYDIAILFSSKVPWRQLIRISHEISLYYGISKVDVVDLRRVPIELAFRIISTGKIIYEKTVYDRVEFEADTMGRYYDSLHDLRSSRDRLLERRSHEAGI